MHDTGQNVRLAGIGWRPIVHVLVGVGLFLLTMSIMRELESLLETLLVALFLAIAADAAARSVQRIGVGRAWSLVIVIVGGLVGSCVIALLLVPPVIDQFGKLVDQAPDIAKSLENNDQWQSMSDKLNLSDDLVKIAKEVAVEIPQVVAETIAALVNGIFGLVTILIAVSFLLAGGGQALKLLLRLAPPLATAGGWTVVIGAYTNIGRYIIGATLQALCAGTSLALVLLVLDVPYALSLGVFMLIMDYIPLVGATIGSVPAVAVALFSGGWFDGIAVLVFLVVYQQIENTIIQPRIQGKVVSLPGIAIFFSVMIGGELLGILGALIAVPCASILAIILRQYFEMIGRPEVVLPQIFDDRGRPLTPEARRESALAHAAAATAAAPAADAPKE